MIRQRAEHVPMASTIDTITIRRATDDDASALDRLARLDSQRLPRGPHLIALAGDRYVAAVSLIDGRWAADPFVHSWPVVELLRSRVAALNGEASPRGLVSLRVLAKRLVPAVR
jgi:hypothetical protein